MSPFLWFDGNAEEATNFYLSVFPNSKALEVNRAGGQELQCGWVRDKFGLTWPVIHPTSRMKALSKHVGGGLMP